MMKQILYHSQLDSPIGQIDLYASDKGIRYCYFKDSHKLKYIQQALSNSNLDIIAGDNHFITKAKRQLLAYFDGEIKSFDVAVDLVGTAFQKSVWTSLMEIPYGKTWSYLTQSKYLKNHKAVRAVANANGRNPISIIIPCHRVIGSNGKLTGYAGGVERKRYLLNLENPTPELQFV